MEAEIKDGDRVTVVMFGNPREGVATATASPDVFLVTMEEGADEFHRDRLTRVE